MPEYLRIKNEGAVNVKRDKPVKVLVVEDNELNAEILIEILKGESFEVDYAENGKVAVEKFTDSEVGELDAILMDIQMPVMDGYEATRTIRSLDREDAKTIPIFACTANSFQEDREKAVASGMNQFLTKPIDVNVLLQKLGGGSTALEQQTDD
jgi:CheY-like chemotaxis protein